MPTTLSDAQADAMITASVCPDENLLLQFLQGARETGEIQAIEVHLDECESCRSLIAVLVQQSWASPPMEYAVDEGGADDDERPGIDEMREDADAGVSLGSSGEGIRSLLAPLASGLPSGFPFGRFRILSRLGMGGMGVVYLAFDPELERQVAIKLVRPEIDTSAHKARLQREARAMARLSHPHIVTVYELGEFAGQLYIVMEYVEGQTLGRWIGQETPSQEQIIARFVEAGRGLSYAHQRGIVHRDFKPDNVLINAHLHAEVTDFGLARASTEVQIPQETQNATDAVSHSMLPSAANGSSRTSVGRTQTGAFVGTLAYMSPEQLRGEKATAQSDQFAFCVALWEALSGQRPFGAREIQARLQEIAAAPSSGALAGVEAIPLHLRSILLRGLSYAPEQRFATMDGLLEALSSTPPTRAVVWTSRWMAAFAVLLCVVAVWWWRTAGVSAPSAPSRLSVQTNAGTEQSRRATKAGLPGTTTSKAKGDQPQPLRRQSATRPRVRQDVALRAGAAKAPIAAPHMPVTSVAKPALHRPLGRAHVSAKQRLAAMEGAGTAAICREGSKNLATCTDSVLISQYHWQLVADIQRGQLTDAKQHFLRLQRAYKREKQRLSPKHPYHLLYAKGLHNRGMVALHSGNPWEARRFLHLSLALQQRLFGAGHLALATTWAALGLTAASLQRDAAARRWQKLSQNAIFRAFGESHFAYGQSLQASAFVTYQSNDNKAAIKQLQQAYSRLSKSLGNPHFYVAIARHNLGLLHMKLGQYGEARRYLRDALASVAKKLPATHFVRGAMLYNLGRLYTLYVSGPGQQGKRYLQKASANLLQSMGMTRSYTRKAWTLLATGPSGRPGTMIKALDGAKGGLSPAKRKALAKEVRPLWLFQPLLLR